MTDGQILWLVGIAIWAAWSLSNVSERLGRVAKALEDLSALARRGRP